MTDYAALTLDASKIEGAIRGFPGNSNTDLPTEGRGFQTYSIDVEGQLSGLLQVFQRADGKCTLNYKLGKNKSLSESVAKHVAELCTVDPILTKPLSLKSISEDDWKFLQESLSDDGFQLASETFALGERFSVSGQGKDQVFIHRYNTGRFLMQGKTRSAYSAVVNALGYTATDRKELIESQLETVSLTVVNCEKLMSELEQRIPIAWSKMDESVKTILAPSLLVHKLSADLPDYSMMVFPALRGMEGCIKDLFAKRGYTLGSKLSIGDQFDQSAKTVALPVKAKLSCAATCSAVEEIYGLFSTHRNGLLHVDSVVAMTRIIDKQAEAAEIVDAALYSIEKAYELAP
jgi:RNase LS, bacterial toxin DBD domain